MMQIITVTLNPTLDKTARLDELTPGSLNRLRDIRTDAGGKGVNVSKTLHRLGVQTTATGFIGGAVGEGIAADLDAWGIRHKFVRVGGATRSNLKVIDRDGRLTELNEPGPEISAADSAALFDVIAALATPKAMFVLSGSIPPGAGVDIYAQLVRLLRSKGARAYVDADGEAFRLAVAERPEFIKPNGHELAEYFGVSETDLSPVRIADLARKLLSAGVGRMAVSLGGDGAVFAGPEGVWHAPALSVEVLSTVGAGDSMVAAMVYGEERGLCWRDACVWAMATSAGTVTTAGTQPPDKGVIEELAKGVVLREIGD